MALKALGTILVWAAWLAGPSMSQPAQSVFGPMPQRHGPARPAKPLPPPLRRFLIEDLRKVVDEDMKKTTLIRWAEVPLPNHSREIVVYISGGGPKDLGEMGGWCGSGGCIVEILTPVGDTFREIGDVQGWLPVRVLPTSHNGRPDLSVWVQGGGVYPGYASVLEYDGKSYPSSDGQPSGRQVNPKNLGKLILDTDQTGTPLYQ